MKPSREELIFALALTKSESERGAFLDGACAADPVLRERLENLLWAHDNPDDITSLPGKSEQGTIKIGFALLSRWWKAAACGHIDKAAL